MIELARMFIYFCRIVFIPEPLLIRHRFSVGWLMRVINFKGTIELRKNTNWNVLGSAFDPHLQRRLPRRKLWRVYDSDVYAWFASMLMLLIKFFWLRLKVGSCSSPFRGDDFLIPQNHSNLEVSTRREIKETFSVWILSSEW